MQKNIFFLVVMFASSLSQATNFSEDLHCTSAYHHLALICAHRAKLLDASEQVQKLLEEEALAAFICEAPERLALKGECNTLGQLLALIKKQYDQLGEQLDAAKSRLAFEQSYPKSSSRCSTPTPPCG